MQQLTKWLKINLLFLLGVQPFFLKAQLSLEQAYELARNNYPLIKQQQLINRTSAISIDNLRKGLLPQISLLGQASYQSDVTEVKVPVPGVNIEPLSKDQYKLVTDLSQVLYDGGLYREQKHQQQLNAAVEQQKLEVDLFKLRERVSQIYLGVLYIDEQLKQVELVKADIHTGIRRVEAQVNNGVAFRSNISLLQAELLKADQRAIELKATRSGFLQALGLLINQTLAETTLLSMPQGMMIPPGDSTITRPELSLFRSQDKLIESQIRLIDARNTPRVSLYAQAGYAKPGLNFLKNEFDFFYIGGLRMNWSLSGLYTRKKEKEIVSLNRKMVESQQETFLLNTRTSLVQQQSEIAKLKKLIDTDSQIIELRGKVKEAAKAQLDNGVITANDYLREVNAEDQARQALITHQLQLLQAVINYKNISGNQ